MPQEKKAFVLGPGFVGREVIDLLQGKGYSITTIVRRAEVVDDFTKDGKAIRVIQYSFMNRAFQLIFP